MSVRGEASDDMSASCTASPCGRERDDRVVALERELKEQQETTMQMKQMIVALKARVDSLERQVARQSNIQKMGGPCYPNPVPFAAIPANIPNTIAERKSLEDDPGEPSPESRKAKDIVEIDCAVLRDCTSQRHQECSDTTNRNTTQGPGSKGVSAGSGSRVGYPHKQANLDAKQHAVEIQRAARPHSSPGKHVYARKATAEADTNRPETERKSREALNQPGSRDSSVSLPSPGRGRSTRQPTPTESSGSSSRFSSRHPTPDCALPPPCDGKGSKSRQPAPTECSGTPLTAAAAKDKAALRYNVNGKNVLVYQPTVATYDRPSDPKVAERRVCTARVQLEYVYGFRGKDTRSGLCVNREGQVVFFAAAVGVVLDPARNTQRFFLGHDDEIRCIAMHPDGATVATGQLCAAATQPLCTVWDSRSCEQRAALQVGGGEGGKGAVASAVAFSPSGRWLAAVFEQGGAGTFQLGLWEWAQGRLLASVPAHSQHPVLCVCFNPDNDAQLVTAGKAHLKFWTIADRRGAAAEGAGGGGGGGLTLRGKAGIFGTGTGTSQKPGFISCVAFGRGGTLLCGTSAGQILVWNETAVLQAMAAHRGAVLSLQACAASGTILSGGADGAVKHWTEFQEPAAPDVEVSGSVRALGLAADGALYVGTSLCEILRVHDGGVRSVLRAHRDAVGGLACHPAAGAVVSVGADGSVLRFDTQRRAMAAAGRLSASAACAAFSEDGQLLAVGLAEGGVVLLHGESLRELWRDDGGRGGGVTDVKFSPGGRLLAVAGTDAVIDVFEVRQLAAVGESEAVAVRRSGRCRGHCVGVLRVDWSVRGGAEGGADDAAEDGRVRGERSRGEMQEGGRGQTAAGGAGEGWYLRSCGKDHGLFFWWVSEGGVPRLLTRGGAECRDAAWATQTCVVGWGVQGVLVDAKQAGDVVAVSRSRDGSLLAVGDASRRLLLAGYPCLSRPAAGKTGRGHAGIVQCVDFSECDERVLTAGGRDMTVMQWRVERGREGDGAAAGKAEAEEGAEEETEHEGEEERGVQGEGAKHGDNAMEGEDMRGGWRVDEGPAAGGEIAASAAREAEEEEQEAPAHSEPQPKDTPAGCDPDSERCADSGERLSSEGGSTKSAERTERWLDELEGDKAARTLEWGRQLGEGDTMAVVDAARPRDVLAAEDEVACVAMEG